MLIMISGQPGNGKTLRAIALMLEEYERNKAANALPRDDKKWEPLREFFANVTGLSFEWCQLMPEHRDWREFPDGSFVLYDEAHSDGKTAGLEHYGLLFPSTGRPGESDDPRIRAMATSRHRGFDLVFITQWPSKIHHNVRQLLGRHIHMNRALGLHRAGVLTWSRVQVDPYDEREREKAEEEIWAFPKELFDKYQSATLHTSTHKFKMPKKVWGALFQVVMLFVVGWLLWIFIFKPDGPSDELDTQEGAAQALAPLGAGGPPLDLGKVVYATPLEYALAHLPRFATMPWTAPIYDDRKVTSDPQLVCMSTLAGLDAQGQYREASCTCLTEQATRYDIRDGECRRMAIAGPVYNPYKQLSGIRGVGETPTVMDGTSVPSRVVIPGVQMSGYGDIGVVVNP